MHKLFALISLLLMPAIGLMAKTYSIASPDAKLKANVDVGNTVTYSLSYNGQQLISPSQIAMQTQDGTWGVGSKLKKETVSSNTASVKIKAHFYKKDEVTDNFNMLTLNFGKFSILFRAYNEGFAYRFVSNTKKAFNVNGETAQLRFASDFETLTPYVKDDGDFERLLDNSFENVYTPVKVSAFDSKKLAFMPVIVKADNGVKMVIAEADVENYPCMFVRKGDAANSLDAYFARFPKEVKQGGHNNLQELVVTRQNYLVQAKAGQKFPWRIVNVSTSDEQLINNDMVYRLASPSRLSDVSWIKPGKVAWDWWNDWGLYKVPFKAGINTETYKYYIDFAAKHGIEYVILDEGWAVNMKADLFQIIPEIDMKAIIDYGKQKGVGIILWAGFKAFDRDMEKVCKTYSEMGVKGFKIDFMNRNDADCVNFLYRSAATAAKYHLMCDFHGIYAPTGLNRTYPNVINFEGVNGQEQDKWATMDVYDQVQYDVTIPFARNLAGPMDYTQGAMLNGTKKTYHPSGTEPMSQGTRCQQLAEYMVFLSPLNMLCDSPTHYNDEPECTDFISGIPTVWDETVPLKSEVGEYVAVARRSGSKWYIGAITNWTPRNLTLDLSPLKVAGKTGTMFKDGPNADRFAQDYVKTTVTVPADGKVQVELAPGGGVAIQL